MLSQSSGTSEEAELIMTQALQIINTHAQLRALSDDNDALIDEVHVLEDALRRLKELFE